MKTFIMLIAAAAVLAACEEKTPAPTPEERQDILADAPDLFVVDERGVTLEGVESFYLGQPKDQALEALQDFCPKTMDYRAGKEDKDAWFRGCVLPEARGSITSVRVGFWPVLDERVATLEVQRTGVSVAAARERFRDLVDELSVDLHRPGIVEMRSHTYQMLADVDDGTQAPTHITVGYNPQQVDQLEFD
jgi:hypothetical protein